MDTWSARSLALSLMKQHGLADWRFAFDHAKRRFGCCNYTRKTISLSRTLTLLNPDAEVRDTILHEIAHALTPGDGHGPKWRAACVRVGAKPQRCFTSEQVIAPPRRPAAMQIGCLTCGWWHDRHRRSTRKLVCKTCRTAVVYREGDAGAMSCRVRFTAPFR